MRRLAAALAVLTFGWLGAAEAQVTANSANLAGSALGRSLAKATDAGQARPGAPGYSVGVALRARANSASTTAAGRAGQQAGAAMERRASANLQRNQQALQAAIADSQVQDTRAFAATTLHGMPVLPPGMTEQQASQYVSHDWPRRREKTAHLFVLISLGMPKAVLRNLLAQVAASTALQDETVFMLRGWESVPQGFQKTVSELQRLQPGGAYKAPVFVDPTWFESLHVTQVPAIVVANSHRNGMLYGDGLSLIDAQRQLSLGRDLNRTLGQTWPIREPDALLMLKSAAKKVDLAKWQEQARDSIWPDLAKKAPALPELAHDQSTSFDPTVVATRDIRLPDGRIVVHAGQRIDPLLQPMPWNTLRFIVFDADRPWQVRQAQAWARQYPTARILMAAPPRTQQGWVAVEHEFGGTPVRLIEPFVAGRLGVSAAPAMIWPHGAVLRVFVKGHPVKEQ